MVLTRTMKSVGAAVVMASLLVIPTTASATGWHGPQKPGKGYFVKKHFAKKPFKKWHKMPVKPTPAPASVPELSAGSAGSAMALLLGAGLLLGSRRRAQPGVVPA